MTDLLSIKMDEIEDVVITAKPQRGQSRPQVDPNNHYIVEAHGVVLTVTENREEAMSVYRDSQDNDKKVVKVWQGKQYQVAPRGFY